MLKKKMTLTLLASALVSGTIFVGQPTVSAAGQVGIIEKSVNFRVKPSLSGDRIRYLKAGEHVNILGQVNNY
ncbi:MAG: SH3 domain-containing protein [Paenibacillaceae bacterium]